jgi:hypothetical protein
VTVTRPHNPYALSAREAGVSKGFRLSGPSIWPPSAAHSGHAVRLAVPILRTREDWKYSLPACGAPGLNRTSGRITCSLPPRLRGGSGWGENRRPFRPGLRLPPLCQRGGQGEFLRLTPSCRLDLASTVAGQGESRACKNISQLFFENVLLKRPLSWLLHVG